MTIVRLLCWVSFTVAVCGLVFGWATVWFAVGMISAAVWVICFGLLLKLVADEQDERINTVLDRPRTPSLYGPYTHPGWDDETELPHRRPVWPREMAPE